MATITPLLRLQKQDAKGTVPIYLRISDRNRSRFVSLGVRIRPSQWNERLQRVRRNHNNADEINAIITRRISEAEAEILKHKAEREEATADDLKAAISPERNEGDFFSYADGTIADLKRRGQIYTHKRFKSIVKKFRAYTGEPLPFTRITPKLLRDYETHLIEQHGNAPNTVRTNFNAIRTIFYRAIKEGLVEQGDNPFFSFTPVKEAKTKRGKLTWEEVQAIEALPLEERSLIWNVRNYFLFSFYCAGIRFGDLAKMTWGNLQNERLTYAMSKTGTVKSIKLLPQARAVLDHYGPPGADSDYIFPILKRYNTATPLKMVSAVSAQNALVNKYLKKIADRAGIKIHLSFHISRHSFADIARTKGWDIYTISKALGHANIRVTEKYLKGFDADALDEKMESLFSEV